MHMNELWQSAVCSPPASRVNSLMNTMGNISLSTLGPAYSEEKMRGKLLIVSKILNIVNYFDARL